MWLVNFILTVERDFPANPVVFTPFIYALHFSGEFHHRNLPGLAQIMLPIQSTSPLSERYVKHLANQAIAINY